MSYSPHNYPYPSQRMVTVGKYGIVSTSQAQAAQAGLDVLKCGGNAIDAAVATAACLTVTEPNCNGIGGDNFALIWYQGKLYGMNASGYAPAALTRQKVLDKGYESIPAFAWESVTVPGAPAGWAALCRRFGRLPLSDLVSGAAFYAEQEFVVSPTVAGSWKGGAERFGTLGDLYVPWMQTFTREGRAPECEEAWTLPLHAETLREIGRTNAESFYRGALAHEIVRFSESTGGYFSAEDLADFKVDWVEPVGINYRGYDVWEIPPNGQGMVALMALNILKGFDDFRMDDDVTLHRQWEAMKLAFVDGMQHIADPRFMHVSVEELLSDAYAAKRRSLIREDASLPEPGVFQDHGTVYLCTADGEGNMVSMIQSNYMGFGSGIAVPGTGIGLHNRGCNFSLDPTHANVIAPLKKPYHTIIPGFLTKDGQAVGPFGVMGGFMQPQGHTQVVMNLVDFGMNPQVALDRPRWRWDHGLEMSVEPDFDADMISRLAQRGHKITVQHPGGFGRGQIILRNRFGTLTAGCDKRCDSQSAVW